MSKAISRYCPLCEKVVVGYITLINNRPYFSCVNGHRSLVKDAT